MNDNQYENDIKILLDILKECKNSNENILGFYCECLMKMHKACYKIEKTEMLSYVKQIVAPVFPLVIQYFSNRVRACLEVKETKNIKEKIKEEKRKAEIRQDIEESVVYFGEVLESIIHSTNGADRILFQSAPIDVGIRYSAPKLCAYYSTFLNEVAKLFHSEDRYAFCVYPTLNRSAEAVLLFSTMNESGKVGIVKVPGYTIASVHNMRVLLLHEIFHVLPGKLRNRRKRARDFLVILFYALRAKLIGYPADRMKENFLFSEVKNEIEKKLSQYGDEDRIFYSHFISEFYVNEFSKHFQTLLAKSSADYIKELSGDSNWESYGAYEQYTEKVKEFREKSSHMVYNILANSELSKMCDFYITLFREAYADVLMILTLGLPPMMYFASFQHEPDGVQDTHIRCILYLRILFVAETMENVYNDINDSQKKLFDDWKDWKNTGKNTIFNMFIKNLEQLSEEFHTKAKDKKKSTFDAGMTVYFDAPMKEHYLAYLRGCVQNYLDYQNREIDAFTDFRRRFNIDYSNSADNINDTISMRKWENESL